MKFRILLPAIYLFSINSYAEIKSLSICKKDGIIYTSVSRSGTPISWVWIFIGGDQLGSIKQNPDPVFYNNAGIFYSYVTTTFNNGQIFLDTFEIVVKDSPMPSFNFPNDTGYCPGNSFPLLLNTTSFGGVSFFWNTGATSSSITVNTAGKYWVNALIKAGTRTCDSVYKEVNVIEYPNPSVYLGQDKFMCQNQSFTLDAGPGAGYRYNWQPTNQTTRTIVVNQPDIYRVTITTDKECTVTDQIELKDSCPHYVFVPNAFSPNEDRLNDIFVKVWNFAPKDYFLKIYNRWGEVLFETSYLQKGWDGTYNNHLVQQDIYVYQIQYLDNDKKVYNLRGTFYVVR